MAATGPYKLHPQWSVNGPTPAVTTLRGTKCGLRPVAGSAALLRATKCGLHPAAGSAGAGLRPAVVEAMVRAVAAMATVTGEEATAAGNDFLLASVSSHRPGPNFSVGTGPLFGFQPNPK